MRFAQPTLAIAFSLLTAAFATVQPITSFAGGLGGSGTTTTVVTPAPEGAAATAATLASTANLSEYNRMVSMAGLKSRLNKATETYTVFAPTNAAIAKLPANIREQLIRADSPGLKHLVRTHIVKGNVNFDQLTDGSELETIDGQKLRVVKQADGTVLLNGVYRLADTGRATTNGTLYTLDSMIVPQ